MNPSPLQLERYFFSKIHIDANLDGDPKVVNELACEVEVGQAIDNARRFQVMMRLKLQAPEKKQPSYTGELNAVGFFRVADSWPEKDMNLLVETNGAALLYGAIRETVCNLTGRGPWPAVTLNTVTFYKKSDTKQEAPIAVKETAKKAVAARHSRVAKK